VSIIYGYRHQTLETAPADPVDSDPEAVLVPSVLGDADESLVDRPADLDRGDRGPGADNLPAGLGRDEDA
jgi:hypothetical protein